MATYCSYCREGAYKDELINPEGDTIGGFINGYWFCGWCYKLGKESEATSETERMELLTEEAERNNAVQIADPEETRIDN